MLYTRACPRCGGAVEYRQCEYGPELACLMCGQTWAKPFARSAGRGVAESPPEDEGCEVAPKCVACPRETCIYEGLDDWVKDRWARIIALHRDGGVVHAAAQAGVSTRTVWRVVRKTRQLAGVS